MRRPVFSFENKTKQSLPIGTAKEKAKPIAKQHKRRKTDHDQTNRKEPASGTKVTSPAATHGNGPEDDAAPGTTQSLTCELCSRQSTDKD